MKNYLEIIRYLLISLTYFSLFMDYGLRQIIESHMKFILPSSNDCNSQGTKFRELCINNFFSINK